MIKIASSNCAVNKRQVIVVAGEPEQQINHNIGSSNSET